MNILICASTTFEISPFLNHIESIAEKKSFLEFRVNGHSIYPLVTGLGAMNTAFAIARFSKVNSIQLAINAGLAGAYNSDFEPGSVVEIIKDRFADLGAENSDGTLMDIFDLELQKPDQFPFHDGWLDNKIRPYHTDLKEATGLTVNKVNGTPLSIALIKEKYQADVESMEGAGFFYACKMMDINCMQLRSISNPVEPRNKDNWKIQLAIERLNQSLIKFIHALTRERFV